VGFCEYGDERLRSPKAQTFLPFDERFYEDVTVALMLFYHQQVI
jgi:hypothetical protein